MIYIILQIILFLPVYLVWRHDSKDLDEDKLAVGLGERFFLWLLLVPIWVIPIIKYF